MDFSVCCGQSSAYHSISPSLLSSDALAFCLSLPLNLTTRHFQKDLSCVLSFVSFSCLCHVLTDLIHSSCCCCSSQVISLFSQLSYDIASSPFSFSSSFSYPRLLILTRFHSLSSHCYAPSSFFHCYLAPSSIFSFSFHHVFFSSSSDHLQLFLVLHQMDQHCCLLILLTFVAPSFSLSLIAQRVALLFEYLHRPREGFVDCQLCHRRSYPSHTA